MIKNNTLLNAYNYLQRIPRIDNIDAHSEYVGDVFFLSKEIDYNINKESLIETYGLSNELDSKVRDLIRVITIKDALNIDYELTNVLTPLMFAESRDDIPWHLNTQALLFTQVTNETIHWIKDINSKDIYDKHEYDKFWLPFCSPMESIKIGNNLCIFNRRVGGWDGCIDKPVIELLGAGGHVPSIWNNKKNCFEILPIKDNIKKETKEELGIEVDDVDIKVFGGYINDVTHELVILAGIYIESGLLPKMQEYAFSNTDPDTMGIYLGNFSEVMEFYRNNPKPFAGGKKSAKTNFPNQKELMKRVKLFFDKGRLM